MLCKVLSVQYAFCAVHTPKQEKDMNSVQYWSVLDDCGLYSYGQGVCKFDSATPLLKILAMATQYVTK